MYYCIKIQKDKNKMAAVCLWLIENKSLQMYELDLVICCGFVQFKTICATWCCPLQDLSGGASVEESQQQILVNISMNIDMEI